MTATLTANDTSFRQEWRRFVEALAGVRALTVRVSLADDGHSYCMDNGVWARRCHPNRLAPPANAALSAVTLAAERFPGVDLDVACDAGAASVLTDALELRVGMTQRPRSGDPRRERVQIGGLDATVANLTRFWQVTDRVNVDVRYDPEVSYGTPVGELRTNARYGRVAEAAYHQFCDEHGYAFVSVDGSAHQGAWGWAWWENPDRWAAGGGTGGSSAHAELTAALQAVRAHRGRRVAISTDYNKIFQLVAGTAAGTPTAGSAALLEELGARSSGERVIWLPFSSDSSSPRHHRADELARAGRRRAAAAGNAVHFDCNT